MLIDKATKRAIAVGDKCKDFRGDEWIVVGWRAPSRPGASAKVHVTPHGVGGDSVSEFYASVFGMAWNG